MWTDQVIAVIYPEETERLLKKLFAAAWVRIPDNPFDAAREVEQEFGKAHYIATRWVEDEEVLQEKARLIAELGPIAKVPTKDAFAAELYMRACKMKEGSEQLKYFETFAKVMNYIEKDNGLTINNNQWAVMSEPLSEEKWIEINGNE